jgi:hypothetical protein
MIRPSPARLIRGSPYRQSAHANDLKATLCHHPNFIGFIESLQDYLNSVHGLTP